MTDSMRHAEQMIADSPERLARIADTWRRHPDVAFDDIEALVDEELAAEQAEERERAARASELVGSAGAFWRCRACGTDIGPGIADAYCGECRAAAYLLAAEAALADVLPDGRTRRAAIEADLAARQKA
jgi:rubrerythrin